MGFTQQQTEIIYCPAKPVKARQFKYENSRESYLTTAEIIKGAIYTRLNAEGVEGVFTDEYLDLITVNPILDRYNETKLNAYQCVEVSFPCLIEKVDSNALKIRLYEKCLCAYACADAILRDPDHVGAGLACEAAQEFYDQYEAELIASFKWRGVTQRQYAKNVSAAGGAKTKEKHLKIDEELFTQAMKWYENHGDNSVDIEDIAYNLRKTITNKGTKKQIGLNKSKKLAKAILAKLGLSTRT